MAATAAATVVPLTAGAATAPRESRVLSLVDGARADAGMSALRADGHVYATQVFVELGLPPAPSRANRPAPTVAQRPAGASAGSELTRASSTKAGPATCGPSSGFEIAEDDTLVPTGYYCKIPV